MGELEPEECVQPDWYRLLRAAPMLGMSARELFEWDPVYRNFWIERAVVTMNVHNRVEEQQRAWSKVQATTGTRH